MRKINIHVRCSNSSVMNPAINTVVALTSPENGNYKC